MSYEGFNSSKQTSRCCIPFTFLNLVFSMHVYWAIVGQFVWTVLRSSEHSRVFISANLVVQMYAFHCCKWTKGTEIKWVKLIFVFMMSYNFEMVLSFWLHDNRNHLCMINLESSWEVHSFFLINHYFFLSYLPCLLSWFNPIDHDTQHCCFNAPSHC